VAADAVVESSRNAAETLHSSIVDQLHREDLNFQDRGVKQALLYVLLDSQVPAVLVESFYLSNKRDLELVSQPENRTRIAEGLAKGILRFLATK
jgi:N-acetylmuramoyl-L-alanine amidase